MQSTLKTLPKGLVELTIEVSLEEMQPQLEVAVQDLTKNNPIKGFRPGKAPYEIVKQSLSEMAIYETALPSVVRKNYVKAIMEAKVLAYGEPNIEVVKLVPGNPIVFKAIVPVVPKVTTLANLEKIKVGPKPITVEEKQVDAMVKELQRMQTRENKVERALAQHDKVVVDMDLSIENVPVEGGQARNHGIYLDEEYYIPGLKEQLIGLKSGDKKSFTLPFAKDHYQKNLAGKDVKFDVTVKDVLELTPPEANDEFAKTVGQESMPKLREILKKNLTDEAGDKERQRQEIEILEKLAEGSKFEEIPEVILNQEVGRMLEELRQSIMERGLEFDAYLSSLKKTIEDLKLDFVPQAIKRIKSALVIREFANQEKIEVSDTDLLKEVEVLLNRYSHDVDSQNRIRSEEYQDYLRTSLRNQKTLQKLREKIVK